MTEQEKREKVIALLERYMATPNLAGAENYGAKIVDMPAPLIIDALALLKAQEQRHRLEVHNIGNIDVPEGVTWEQFQAVMSGVVKALEHTDRGESWPYDEGGGEVGMNISKPICKVFGIPCEFATSLGYCQFTACVKVRPGYGDQSAMQYADNPTV